MHTAYKIQRHSTVPVKHNGIAIRIDTKIAPLLREIWRADIETDHSCQEDPVYGRVSIGFPSSRHLEAFLDIAGRFRKENSDLRGRMQHFHWEGDCPSPGQWAYGLSVTDLGLVDDEFVRIEPSAKAPPPMFSFGIAAEFPPCDLPTVLANFVEHNKIRTD